MNQKNLWKKSGSNNNTIFKEEESVEILKSSLVD